MRVMLDQSPAKIAEYTEKFQYEFWQFRTPLTRYKIAPVPWGLDNGCFTHFHRKEWEAMLIEAKKKYACFRDSARCVGRCPKDDGIVSCLFLENGASAKGLGLAGRRCRT